MLTIRQNLASGRFGKVTHPNQSGAREVTTIYDAGISGTLAAMSSHARREDVPIQFARREATKEAWQEAFDRMRQDLRGVPVEAEKKSRSEIEADDLANLTPKKAGKPKKGSNMLTKPTISKAPQPKPSMDSIALTLHHEARECA
jgi:hypothetical protein